MNESLGDVIKKHPGGTNFTKQPPGKYSNDKPEPE
jgi:hypothetical protein